ncbi:MAG TPA: MFS transporter [Pseudonocardiaceae bacterium]|nr:MFS transporter [Pseudonocardiaceae bacterium]
MSAPSIAASGTTLIRNRNYQLLWISQALSGAGLSASVIAFPLLVLALTGSATASGVVLGTIAAAQLLAGLPAGALADRWDRKKIMLSCEALQVVAAASLVAALAAGMAEPPHLIIMAHLIVVAAVMGICAALFRPAEDACLPRVVPAEQLPTAVALNAARASLAQLAGTAAGGFLFALARFVPFLADALAHTLACSLLMFLRVPPRENAPAPVQHLGRDIRDGLRWVWRRRHIRVAALSAVALNLFFSAFYLIVIVLAQGRGVPPGQIGVMAAMLGVGGLLGALAASRLTRLVSPYTSIIVVFWGLAALTPVAAVLYSGYLLGILFAAMAILPATANTTIITGALLLTPDELRGRLSSVLTLLSGSAAVLGPVLGGLLTTAFTGGVAVLLCAAGAALTALVATLSPALRSFPRPPRGAASQEQVPPKGE